MLEHNSSIKILDLTTENLTDYCAKRICEPLKNNLSLVRIDIDSTQNPASEYLNSMDMLLMKNLQIHAEFQNILDGIIKRQLAIQVPLALLALIVEEFIGFTKRSEALHDISQVSSDRQQASEKLFTTLWCEKQTPPPSILTICYDFCNSQLSRLTH